MEPDSPYRSPDAEVGGGTQTDDLREVFIGPKNTHYYLNQFEKFDAGGGSMGWHWPAFFVTWFWLGYRKMWGWFFAYWLLFPIVMVLIGGAAALIEPALGSIVYILGYFLIPPLFANRLYYRHAQKKTTQATLANTEPQRQALEAARLGGTSNIVIIILPIVMVALIGILAAIAIPAYQDYTIRAQISEGLNLSGNAKAAVSEYYLEYDAVPVDNVHAGLAAPHDISGQYTASVEISNGEITVTYGNNAHPLINDKQLYLLPNDAGDGAVEWTCGSTDIADKHLPSACR